MSDPDCQMVSLKINVLILCNYLIIHGICTYKGIYKKKLHQTVLVQKWCPFGHLHVFNQKNLYLCTLHASSLQ